jgi:hypothetical protein
MGLLRKPVRQEGAALLDRWRSTAMALFSLHHSAIGRSTHAPGTAGAHVRYISRERAMTDHVERLPPEVEHSPQAVKAWVDGEELGDRVNARVVDKLTVALPRELNADQQRALVRDYCDKLTRCEVPYYAAIHAGPKDADNPHAHIILRDRDFVTGKRVMQTSEKGSTDRFREEWETAANRALERAGRDERIDRRSLKEQGIDREPTRHEGPNVRAMEERDIPTRIGEESRNVRAYNQVVEQERGALIDFQKAKAELEQERGIVDRHQGRMKTGTWDEEGSLAVAQVERQHDGPVAPNEITRLATAADNNLYKLTHETEALAGRQAHIEKALQKVQGYRAEMERRGLQEEKDYSLWNRIKYRMGEWNDTRLMKKAVLCRDVDPIRQRMNARADVWREVWQNSRRLKELPYEIKDVLEDKPESSMRDEWAKNQQRLKELAPQTREAQFKYDLYTRAEDGYDQHRGAERRVREERIDRDPEIQARHKERLRSGVWHPKDSRGVSRVELEAGGPVTRKWLHEQIARTSDPEAQVPYDRALACMDHADELKGYKRDRARHVPGVPRDRETEKELKDIGREVMKELDPERYIRTLARDRSRDYGGWDRGGR